MTGTGESARGKWRPEKDVDVLESSSQTEQPGWVGGRWPGDVLKRPDRGQCGLFIDDLGAQPSPR